MKLKSIPNLVGLLSPFLSGLRSYSNSSALHRWAPKIVLFQNICWENFSPKIEEIFIKGGDAQVNDVKLNDKKKLVELIICNLKLRVSKTIDSLLTLVQPKFALENNCITAATKFDAFIPD